MTEAEFLPLFDRYRPMVYGLALSYTRCPSKAKTNPRPAVRAGGSSFRHFWKMCRSSAVMGWS